MCGTIHSSAADVKFIGHIQPRRVRRQLLLGLRGGCAARIPIFGLCTHTMRQAGVSVAFSMHVETQWGDTAVVVGSTPELGEWIPERGLHMSTSDSLYPRWDAHLVVHAASVEYKLVIIRADGAVQWEDLPQNRSLIHVGGQRIIYIRSTWNDARIERKDELESAPPPAPCNPTPLTSDVFQSDCSLMAHPTTPAWPNIPTTLCARGPAAFQHAPRPNLSFTVLGGSMAAQQVLPGLPYWSSPAAQPIFAGPPPTVAGAVPIVAGPTPIVAGPPPIDSGLAARLQVGQRLETIQSMDMSWPPSCGSSFKSNRSVSEAGSFHRSRSAGSFSSRSVTSSSSRSRLDPADPGEHEQAATVLGRAVLGRAAPS